MIKKLIIRFLIRLINHPEISKAICAIVTRETKRGMAAIHVPFDNYPASLHRGERVVTKEEAQALRPQAETSKG
ncbi:MAG: hypothetical protein WC455_17590 [Dehalococcoidia bacterium]|jgi:hypothetical protein